MLVGLVFGRVLKDLDGFSMVHILLGAGDGVGSTGSTGSTADTGVVDATPSLLRGHRAPSLPTRNDTLVYYPQLAQRERGLYAARCGRFKAHFATQGSLQVWVSRQWV